MVRLEYNEQTKRMCDVVCCMAVHIIIFGLLLLGFVSSFLVAWFSGHKFFLLRVFCF